MARDGGGMVSGVHRAADADAAAGALVDAAWSRPPADVLAALDSETDGLTVEEVEARLERFGPNRLAPPRRSSWWRPPPSCCCGPL